MENAMTDAQSQIEVSIIVVSYQTRDLTQACLSSILEETKQVSYEIIVVDNDSDDGSADMIESTFPTVDLVRSDVNHGFARANNVAAERASGSYLLLLNPDTVVLDHAIDRLLAFAGKHPAAGIWGGRTVYADGSLNPSSCWGRQTGWSILCRAVGVAAILKSSRIFNPESYGNWKRDSIREVDIVTGCFFLIRRDLWHQLNGFDESFLMYGEEADLCLRARRLGARPMITPDATIIHYDGASERVHADRMVRTLGSQRLMIQKHWPTLLIPMGMGLLRLLVGSRALAAGMTRILPSNSFKERFSTWPEVWRRRQEWLRRSSQSVETLG
jgi:GT2 family glycosyltransferase